MGSKERDLNNLSLGKVSHHASRRVMIRWNLGSRGEANKFINDRLGNPDAKITQVQAGNILVIDSGNSRIIAHETTRREKTQLEIITVNKMAKRANIKNGNLDLKEKHCAKVRRQHSTKPRYVPRIDEFDY